MFDANADHGSGERLLTRLMRRARLRSRRPGAVLALVALSLVGLVGVVALAIDIGMLYSARAEAQRVADAAALAGASSFLDFDPLTKPVSARDTAEARAFDYATRQTLMGQWIQSSEVFPEIKLDSQKVRVYIRRATIPLYFARIFGMQLGAVSAVAAAEAVTAGTVTCIKPFAIPDIWTPATPEEDRYKRGTDRPIWDFDAHLFPEYLPAADTEACKSNGDCPPEVWNPRDPGATYDGDVTGYDTHYRDNVPDYQGRKYTKDEGRRVPLKLNYPKSVTAPSYFFPWRMPGSSGGKDYEESLKGCVEGNFSVGGNVEIDPEQLAADGVETETGNMIGPTRKGIKELIDQDKNAKWVENADGSGGQIVDSRFANLDASPRVITVALIDPTTVRSGMNSMKFVNFAQFFLEDPGVVYPHVKPAHHAPITGRLIKYVGGQGGPTEGSMVKRLRLIE
jgi:hypothetical protein